MLHRLTFLLCLVLCATSGHGQVDSLKNVLESQVADTSKVWAYRDLSYYLLQSDLDAAERYAKKGVRLADSISFYQGKERNMRMLGFTLEYRNKLDEALSVYTEAIEVARVGRDDKAVADLLNIQGIACYFQGDRTRALSFYEKARLFCDSIQYYEGAAYSLNNMAIIFRQENNFKLAAETYQESIKIKAALGDSSGMAASYGNLGVALNRLDQPQQAEEAFKKSIDLYERIGQPNETHWVQVSRAEAMARNGRTEDALALFDAHYIQARDADHIRSYISYGKYGELLMDNDRFDLAKEVLLDGYEKIKGTERLQELESFELLLSRVYHQQGDAEQALLHLQRYNTIRDSLASSEKARLIEEFQAKFDTRKKEDQIRLQTLELDQKKQEQTLLVVIIVFAALMLIIVAIAGWNVSMKNRELRAQKELIESALADREVLLKEIHHRVKNNLQIISSLLSLQSRSIEDENALEAVNESRNRVHSMALIHENLYNREDLRNIKTSTYIERLCQDVLRSYNIEKGKINLKTNIEELALDVDEVIPLGLIINELITNCVKYAFPEARSGTIQVELKEVVGQIMLRVQDDGVGIPNIVETDAPRKSIGMRLVDTFSKKLKGSWKVENQNGTRVSLYFTSLEMKKGSI